MKLKGLLKVALVLLAISTMFVACDTLAGGKFPITDTVYAKLTEEWSAQKSVWVWAWPNGGSGKWLEVEKFDNGIIGCYIPDGYENVIFASFEQEEKPGSDWKGKVAQTADLKVPLMGDNAVVYSIEEGAWVESEDDLPAVTKPETPAEPETLAKKYTLKITADGFNEGDAVVVNGTIFGWNGWPFEGWLCWTDDVQDTEKAAAEAAAWIAANAEKQVVVADADGKISLEVELSTDNLDHTLMLVLATVVDGKYSSVSQTQDIPVVLPEEEGTYNVVVNYSESTAEVTPYVPETIDILITNNKGWSKMYVYYWGVECDTWPGIELTEKVTNDYGEEQFKATIPVGVQGIIFNNGEGEQTVDILDFDSSKSGYWIGDKNSDGKYVYGSW